MQVFGVRFAQELGKLIEARVEEIKINLAKGAAVKSMEDYRFQIGMVRAFDEVLEMFEIVESKIENGE